MTRYRQGWTTSTTPKGAILNATTLIRHLLPILLLAAGPVLGEATGQWPALSVRGFGTLGLAHNSNDQAGFIRDVTQPRGPKGDTRWDLDSRLGLQLDLDIGNNLSATVQGISRYNHAGNFDPELAWGFVKFSPDDSLDLRAGRLGWDIYMLADSRDVGYSYLWARPPVEYYGPLQFSKINGADLVLRHSLGNGVLWGKLFAGQATGKLSLDARNSVDVAGTDLAGGHINYETGPWLARLGYTRLDLAVDINGPVAPLMDLLAQFPEVFEAISPEDTYHLYSVGLMFDEGPLQAQLMLGYQKSEPPGVPDANQGYVSVAYRMGQWTPFATASFANALSSALTPELPPGLPLPAGIGDSFSANTTPDQTTLSLGARYDLWENIALKVQYDHVNVRSDGRGYMLWREQDSGWDGRAGVFTATLDFVF